ncbi:hypothetical protein CNECB9_2540030 [Cupriavidus necator]|uniref:Uncharacterized protein n=1 Tax=Cupriavidus necator TaxID=106590 RepID=A0A1K0IFT6_CUPNE|nr:hypothetical protein CNECB9_2540030 [Cupriavidus necator]
MAIIFTFVGSRIRAEALISGPDTHLSADVGPNEAFTFNDSRVSLVNFVEIAFTFALWANAWQRQQSSGSSRSLRG